MFPPGSSSPRPRPPPGRSSVPPPPSSPVQAAGMPPSLPQASPASAFFPGVAHAMAAPGGGHPSLVPQAGAPSRFGLPPRFGMNRPVAPPPGPRAAWVLRVPHNSRLPVFRRQRPERTSRRPSVTARRWIPSSTKSSSIEPILEVWMEGDIRQT